MPSKTVHELQDALAAGREQARKEAEAALVERAKAAKAVAARGPAPTPGRYETRARAVGALVDEKNAAYGSAFDKAGAFLRLLYPDGIRPEQYADMLAVVRVFDKLMRIATDRDALGESPWSDVAGYALLSLERVERERAVSMSCEPAYEPPIDGESARAMGLTEAIMRGAK